MWAIIEWGILAVCTFGALGTFFTPAPPVIGRWMAILLPLSIGGALHLGLEWSFAVSWLLGYVVSNIFSVWKRAEEIQYQVSQQNKNSEKSIDEMTDAEVSEHARQIEEEHRRLTEGQWQAEDQFRDDLLDAAFSKRGEKEK